MRVTDHTADRATIYSDSQPYATHWGKYDSAFHAYLIECVEPDAYDGDTDFGGAMLFGRFLDLWDSYGFHSLTRFDSRQEAQQAFEEWSNEFFDATHEHEFPCWVCGNHQHCGCVCGYCDQCDDYKLGEHPHDVP